MRDPMTDTWRPVKILCLLAAALAVALWGGALVGGFLEGSISGARSGFKLVIVACLLVWLYDRWTLLSNR